MHMIMKRKCDIYGFIKKQQAIAEHKSDSDSDCPTEQS